MAKSYLLSIAEKYAKIVHNHNFWADRTFSFSTGKELGIFTTSTTIIPENLYVNIKGMPIMSAVIGLSNQINESPDKECGCFIVGAVGSQSFPFIIKAGEKKKTYEDVISLPKDKIGAYVFFILFPLGIPGTKKKRLLSSVIQNIDTEPMLVIQASKVVCADVYAS